MTDESELWRHITGLPIKRVEHFDGGVQLSTTDEDDPPIWPQWSFSTDGAQLAITEDESGLGQPQ